MTNLAHLLSTLLLLLGFQEDTFAVDSLRHIISLLESLDSHSFTLLTSLSLSNHSRLKDLWIFTGLSDDPNQDVRLNPSLDFPVSPPATPVPNVTETRVPPVPSHRKMKSVPVLHSQHSQPSFSGHHVRAATDGNVSVSAHNPHEVGVLRKPPPRQQILIPVTKAPPVASNNEEGERVTLPSTVGSAVNMTGVGAGASAVLASKKPDLQIALSAREERSDDLHDAGESSSRSQMHNIIAPVPMLAIHNETPLLRPSYGLESGSSLQSSIPNNSMAIDSSQYLEVPVQTDSAASSPKHWTPPVDQPRTPSPPPASPTPPPFGRCGRTQKGSLTASTLFGSSAFSSGIEEHQEIDQFRDSAFTTGSDWKSCEIPIKWTGPMPEKKRASTEHSFPGAWDPSPPGEYEEDPEQEELKEDQQREPIPDQQDAGVSVKSPEPVHSEDSRKSEAGLADVMPDETDAAHEEKQDKLKRTSDAWVVVNIEGRPYFPILEAPKHVGPDRMRASVPAGFSIHSTMKDQGSSENWENVDAQKPQASSGTSAPAARTITIDSSGGKERKNRLSLALSPPLSPTSPPTLKRLLSSSPKEKEDKSKSKGGLRLRWKRFGSNTKP
jgi:hypothetical protein